PDAGKLLLPALNNMIDIATTRAMSLQVDPPRIIYARLFDLELILTVLVADIMASCQHRSWLHILGFTVITVIVMYFVLDVEYPRTGIIRLETADQLLVKARENMK